MHNSRRQKPVCTYVDIYNCSLDEPLDLLIDYFKKFGQKLCCFDDTRVFITKLLSASDADKAGGSSFIFSAVCCIIHFSYSWHFDHISALPIHLEDNILKITD